MIFLILPTDVGHRGKLMINLAMKKKKKGFLIRNVVISLKKLSAEEIDKINSPFVIKKAVVLLRRLTEEDIKKLTSI
jgi:hypothetical protein